jgi:hypothetical protein
MPIAPLCRWASLPSVRREPVRDESRDVSHHANASNEQSATRVDASTQTLESSFASKPAPLPPPPPPPMEGLASFKPTLGPSAELNALNADQGSKRKPQTLSRATIWGDIAKHIQRGPSLKSTSPVEPRTPSAPPVVQPFLFGIHLRTTRHALFESRVKAVTCDE